MAHGAMAGFLYQIPEAQIAKHCEVELLTFNEFVKEKDVDLHYFGIALDQDDDDVFIDFNDGVVDDPEELLKELKYYYQQVVDAFDFATSCTIGLTTIDNEDEGSPYDDLRGETVWYIEATMIRPEVEVLGEDAYQFKVWTTYG